MAADDNTLVVSWNEAADIQLCVPSEALVIPNSTGCDVAEFASRFENQLVVLTHFSRRYSRQEIRDTIRRRCPKSLVDRIRVAIPE